MSKQGAILIGYQGVGKSTLAKDNVEFIDLESGNFWVDGKRSDDWYKIYCSIAEHLCSQGKYVFVSSHKVVRDRLKESGCKVGVIYPSTELKDFWLQRLKSRYMETKLEKDYKAYMNANCVFEENIKDLMDESSFEHVVIEHPIYDLKYLLWCKGLITYERKI